MHSRSSIVALVFILLLFVMLQTGLTIYKAYEATQDITGNALSGAGSIYMCINEPVSMHPFSCNTSLTEDVFFECQLNASDPDNQTLTFSHMLLQGNLTYSLNSSGYFSTVPNQSDVGVNISVLFRVNDSSGCPNGEDAIIVNFNVTPVNDAPRYLPREGLQTPMGPYNWEAGAALRGIYLNQYFDDPDGDPLNYSASMVSSPFSVTIIPATTEVIFSASDCTTIYIFLRATDPYGLFAESDLIELTTTCPQEEEEEQSSSGSSKGPQRCVPDWKCGDWGRCYENGTQKRKCTDINLCESEYEKYFWRECEYIPQCSNGIKDFFWEGSSKNEVGVDCGGPCPACQTCTDGILNNGELEIDCGGPNCPPCANCFNGIQDYDETGIDCGGPVCDACPSCVDGIQNQNETGIDCGGPNCPPCRRLETPEELDSFRRTLAMILIPLLALLIAGMVIYRIFKKQIRAFFARLWWYLSRKHHKQILLTQEQKHILLEEIKAIQGAPIMEFADELTHESMQYDVAIVLRKLFTFLIGSSLELDSVSARIEQLRTTKLVEKILKDHYKQLLLLERKKQFSPEAVNLQLELLRERVFSLSKITHADVSRPIQEMEPDSEIGTRRLVQFLYNAVLAIQFKEVEVAKKKYLEALHVYDQLPPKMQGKVYDVLGLVFEEIGYVAAYADHEKE